MALAPKDSRANLKQSVMAQKLEFKAWIKQVLPPEHGSWAFVIEPLLIAGIVGKASFILAGIGGFLLFLGYRPTFLALKDLQKKKTYPRTIPSLLLGLGFNGLGLACLALSQQWLVLVIILVAGNVFAQLDQNLPPRSLWRELVGSLLMLPVAIFAAPLAWLVLILRPLAAVLSVRGVINRMDDANACRWAGVAVGALLIGASLWQLGFGFRTAAYSLAGVRTLYLALTPDWERKATKVGIAESVVALLIVLSWIETTL
jgi:hypothetical protein